MLLAGCVRAVVRASMPNKVLAASVLVAPWVPPLRHHFDVFTLSSEERAAMLRFEDELPTFGMAPEVGEYLRERTEPGEPVLVIGSEPQIYFYAQRPSSTRMVISYPMIAPYTFSNRLRDAYFAGLAVNQPRYLVMVNVVQSHSEFHQLVGPHIAKVQQLLSANYELEVMLPRGAKRKKEGARFQVYRRKDA